MWFISYGQGHQYIFARAISGTDELHSQICDTFHSQRLRLNEKGKKQSLNPDICLEFNTILWSGGKLKLVPSARIREWSLLVRCTPFIIQHPGPGPSQSHTQYDSLFRMCLCVWMQRLFNVILFSSFVRFTVLFVWIVWLQWKEEINRF